VGKAKVGGSEGEKYNRELLSYMTLNDDIDAETDF
jgi:hypothetical protein